MKLLIRSPTQKHSLNSTEQSGHKNNNHHSFH